MKSKLDLLELFFQKFIETSANFLWHDEHLDLVRKLIEVMDEDKIQNTEFDIPSEFVIHLPPQKYILWRANKELIEGFSIALQEAAVEVGLHPTSRPTIHLEMDGDLAEDDLRVHILRTEKTAAKTAIISSGNSPKTDDRNVKAFLILENGVHFPLNKSVIHIGRREENELIVDDPRVSRDHAQIRYVQDAFVLFDLNSTGGTFVNGRKIVQYNLQPGDVISLANHPFIYLEEELKPSSPKKQERTISQTTRIVLPSEGEEETE